MDRDLGRPRFATETPGSLPRVHNLPQRELLWTKLHATSFFISDPEIAGIGQTTILFCRLMSTGPRRILKFT